MQKLFSDLLSFFRLLKFSCFWVSTKNISLKLGSSYVLGASKKKKINSVKKIPRNNLSRELFSDFFSYNVLKEKSKRISIKIGSRFVLPPYLLTFVLHTFQLILRKKNCEKKNREKNNFGKNKFNQVCKNLQV